jgi:hypothetical protein
MRMMRTTTFALALGAVMAASVFGVTPARAEAEGGDPMQNNIDSRFHNNMHGYTATTTYYSSPAYVPAPAPAMTYTTVSPGGTTTTTYMGPSIAYVPAPAYSATTVIAPRPCNWFDVPRAGVTTACPY